MKIDKSAIPDFLRIEITHKNGTEYFDPTSLIMAYIAVVDRNMDWEPVPGRVSDISGEPGIGYKTNEVDICLTKAELSRLVFTALTPAEFFKLRALVPGPFHEIHDDFYDEETGEALQPR